MGSRHQDSCDQICRSCHMFFQISEPGQVNDAIDNKGYGMLIPVIKLFHNHLSSKTIETIKASAAYSARRSG